MVSGAGGAAGGTTTVGDEGRLHGLMLWLSGGMYTPDAATPNISLRISRANGHGRESFAQGPLEPKLGRAKRWAIREERASSKFIRSFPRALQRVEITPEGGLR